VELEYSDLRPGLQPGEETHGWRRIARIALGVVLVIAGIAMLVLPGQGILTILLGLNLIKPDNAIVRWIRRRTPGIPDDGPIPLTAILVGMFLFVAVGIVSLLYGSDIYEWGKDRVL
jgi:drug/metabolite transporter (DMT)-like permease